MALGSETKGTFMLFVELFLQRGNVSFADPFALERRVKRLELELHVVGIFFIGCLRHSHELLNSFGGDCV